MKATKEDKDYLLSKAKKAFNNSELGQLALKMIEETMKDGHLKVEACMIDSLIGCDDRQIRVPYWEANSKPATYLLQEAIKDKNPLGAIWGLYYRVGFLKTTAKRKYDKIFDKATALYIEDNCRQLN